MWIQDTILKKKKFLRIEEHVRTTYFNADTGNDFILAPPIQSQKKSFISDIDASFRNSRVDRDSLFDSKRYSTVRGDGRFDDSNDNDKSNNNMYMKPSKTVEKRENE